MSQLSFVSVSAALTVLSGLIGIVLVFLKIRQLLLDTDPGKKVRNSEKHRLEALNFFNANCSDAQSFVIDKSDSQIIAAHKSHLWKAYDVKYSLVTKFDKEDIDSLSKPLEAMLEYQSAAGAFKKDDKFKVFELRSWLKIGMWSFKAFSFGAFVSAIAFFQLSLQIGGQKLGISDIETDLVPYLIMSSTLLLTFGLSTFATHDAYKKHRAAERFLSLWGERREFENENKNNNEQVPQPEG